LIEFAIRIKTIVDHVVMQALAKVFTTIHATNIHTSKMLFGGIACQVKLDVDARWILH